MKQKIYSILNAAFYPFALVIAFRAFAFESYGWLMFHFCVMTVIAIINETTGRLDSRKAEIFEGVIVKIAVHLTAATKERDQLKLDCITLAEELAERSGLRVG